MFGCLTGWLCRYSRLRLVCCTTKLSFRCNICCWSRITDEAPQISGYNYQLICTTFHKDCMYSALLLWIVSISYTFFFTGFNCGTTLCPYTVVLRFFVPYQYKGCIYLSMEQRYIHTISNSFTAGWQNSAGLHVGLLIQLHLDLSFHGEVSSGKLGVFLLGVEVLFPGNVILVVR